MAVAAAQAAHRQACQLVHRLGLGAKLFVALSERAAAAAKGVHGAGRAARGGKVEAACHADQRLRHLATAVARQRERERKKR